MLEGCFNIYDWSTAIGIGRKQKCNGLSQANKNEESNEETESAARRKCLQAGRTNYSLQG